MKEVEIQKPILEYLTLRGIFHYRQNTGAFKREDGHFYRFGATGSPDIICVINGRYIGLEMKTPIGKQSEHQKAFQEKLSEAGGIYFLVRSFDEAVEAIEDALKRLPEVSS